MSDISLGKRIKRRYEELKTLRSRLDTDYELLAEYVLGVGDSQSLFSSGRTQTGHGQLGLMSPNVFDATASHAVQLCVSSMIGALWPSGGRTVKLKMPQSLKKFIPETAEIKAHYELATSQLIAAIDDPHSGHAESLEEYLQDQIVYGTSGRSVRPGVPGGPKLKFQSVLLCNLFVDEGESGQIDVVYRRDFLTLRQLVQRYGIEALPGNFRDEWEKNRSDGSREEYKEVVVAIEPRAEWDPDSEDAAMFPVASCHVLAETGHVLRKSGFRSMPVFVNRFWKKSDQLYGFSPGGNAFKDVAEINRARETAILAAEQKYTPTMLCWDSSALGRNGLRWKPREVVITSVSGRMASWANKIIEPLQVVGDMQEFYGRIETLTQSIRNHFFLDRLLDLNNQARMTLGETELRDSLRSQSLAPVFARQLNEHIVPVLEHAIDLLYGMGEFGVPRDSERAVMMEDAGLTPPIIPDELVQAAAQGLDIYEIEFLSEAARSMKSAELDGIQKTLTMVMQLAQVHPDILDIPNWDSIIKDLSSLQGAPDRFCNSAEAVEQARQQKAEQQQQLQQFQLQIAQASAAKDQAAADKMNRGG